MGIGNFLSTIGSFAPQIVPRKPVTPPFLPPEDPYSPDENSPVDARGFIGAKPPVSAASQIGASVPTYRPDLDPDTQKYLDAARAPAPAHPAHGKARGIGEALTKGFLGQDISEQLWDHDYAQQKADYERGISAAAFPAKIRAQADKQAADTSHTMAAGALTGKQADNYEANAVLDAAKQGMDPGTAPITIGGRQLRFPPKQTVAGNIQGYIDAGYTPEQAKVLAAGGKPSDFEKPQSVKSLEEIAARTLMNPDMTPEAKDAKLEEIRKAHNVLNPEKPVIHWAEGKDGTVTAVTATPSEVAQGGGSKDFGKIGKPQPPRESAAGGDDALISAVIANPAIFENLTPKAKERLAPKLQSAGFDGFGKSVSESAMGKMAESTSAIESLKDLRKTLTENEQYIGPVAGLAALNPYSEARKAQAKIDLVKQRVGKALEGGVLRKEDEEKYKKILATLSDTPATAIAKVDGIIATLERDAEIFRNQQRAGGRRVGNAPSQPSGFSVTDPNGVVHTFPTQQAADAFKKAAGIK